jgi:hypothetical protein
VAEERVSRARLALEGPSIGDAFGEQFFVGDDAAALDRVVRRVTPDGPWRARREALPPT